MEDFYETWLSQEGPSDPAQALYETKLAYITSSDPLKRDPAAWSPYVLFEG